jgi:YjbE family integral membrane protein
MASGSIASRRRNSVEPDRRAMAVLADPQFWARLFSIMLIDLALAGDNALVIALAVRHLPPRQQRLGRLWGTAAAIGLRLAFIALVSALLRIPLLQLAGGLVLLWIAVKLVRPGAAGEGQVRGGASLAEAIWIIVVADVTMSLDNVLAVAAAARGDFLLVTIGIALSLPLVVWGSGLLSRLMTRHTWIIWLGGGVLGYVAGEMMTDDPMVRRWLGGLAELVDDPVSLALAAGIGALGWWLARTGGRRRGTEARG